MATLDSHENHQSEFTSDTLALIRSRNPELDGDLFSEAGTVHAYRSSSYGRSGRLRSYRRQSSLLRTSVKESSFAKLSSELTAQAESKFLALMEVLANASKEASSLRVIWETMKHEREGFLQEHEAILAHASEATTELKSREDERARHTAERLEWKKKVDKLAIELQASHSNTAVEKDRIQDRDRELGKVRAELLEAHDSLFRKDSQYERELELLRGRLKQAESERNSVTESSERYHRDMNKALRDRTELTAKLAEVTSSYDSSQKEVVSLTSRLKSFEAERDEAVQTADHLKEEVKRFKAKSAEDAREAQEATEKYEKVSRDITRLKETLTVAEVERNEHLQTAESLRRQIKAHVLDHEDLTASFTELSQKYDAARREVITIQEKLRAIEVASEQDREVLERTRSSLQSATRERDELADELITVTKRLDEQRQQASIAREELIKTEEKKSELHVEVSSLTEKIRYIQRERDEVRSKTEQQTSEITQLRAQITTLERERHEAVEAHTTLNAELEHVRQQYSQVTETITSYGDDTEELESEIDSLRALVQEAQVQRERAVNARQSADRERDIYITRYEEKCRELEQFKEGTLSHTAASPIERHQNGALAAGTGTMSAAKRRLDMATPAPKRQRREDNQWPDRETAETTTATGLKFIAQLKRSTDKNGRGIVGAFLDLPDRNEYPDYYQQIVMPLSVTMIEAKLNQGRYHTMTEFESDLKRVVQNAKDYNDSRSEIFQDAERIRKALSNFMPKHNPAYEDPDYRAVPTPIPQALLDRMRESSVSTNATAPDRVKLEAMLELLDKLSEQENAVNFEKKPPKRDYPDYYKLIERPTSISDVKTLVRQGKVGDWDSLAREVRLIWDNAKEYNEPGSDIYAMTEALESWFEEQVQAAGAAPRARLPRLSLSQPKRTGIKLKMGTTTPTPNISGGAVDSESLKRQKEEMSQALSRANRRGSRSLANGTPDPASSAASVARSLSSVEPSDVTMTGPALPTPVMNGVPPSMQAPTVNGHQYPDGPGSHGSGLSRSIYSASNNPIERKYRDPGKGLADALLASVTYMTHPNLPGDPKWKLQRFSSASKTQTSSYIYLPSSHFYLRLIPTLTDELRSRKNYKVCVSANWQSVLPSSAVPPTYDFRLQPGENIIVVDVIADLKSGEKKDYAPPQMQFDFERIQLVIVLVDRSD
ncbi:hypothetical protein DV737_g1597, partial [Chaetothyriales sp. CBS 132003]